MEYAKDLSIIVPTCNEFPQVKFTVNNLYCELKDSGINFEVIVVDNWCQEVGEQIIKTQIHTPGEEIKEIRTRRIKDDTETGLGGLAGEKRLWLKYIKYTKKLSHWQAKNEGIKHADGKFLFFCDSHCIVSKNSLVNMFNYYKENYQDLNGTLHLPLAYMLETDGKELIYKLVTDMSKGVVHYSFTGYKHSTTPYQVPCMSTCGMLMTRELYDLLGGWPSELGIYGGGENFINFTLAILGKTINIFPTAPLYHYAAKRGYNWNYTDYHRNRTIASYMYGDAELAHNYIINIKGRPSVLRQIYTEVNERCREQRDYISKNQVIDIYEWVDKWTK